jgi:N-sulfoglucosamine sulfohydrolase
MQERSDLLVHGVPEQFFDLKNDPDALANLIDDPDYQDLIATFQKQMLKTMEASQDPSTQIFKNRHDEDLVAAWLTRLDEESEERQRAGYVRRKKPRRVQ